MITKNELCWIIVNDHFDGREINESDILQSSSLAVAMLHLGLIKDEAMKMYAESRGGVLFCGNSSPKGEKHNVATLSVADILTLLPD